MSNSDMAGTFNFRWLYTNLINILVVIFCFRINFLKFISYYPILFVKVKCVLPTLRSTRTSEPFISFVFFVVVVFLYFATIIYYKILTIVYYSLASLVAQMIKCLPAMRETQVWSLGWEDPLEKEMVTYSNTLVWKIQGWRGLVGYSSWVTKSRTQLNNITSLIDYCPCAMQ